MSSVSSTSSSTASQGTLGDAPPVSFPGVASGIDYNAIIQKYTALTLQQEQPLATQVNTLNQQNAEILKIKTLLGSVQDSLSALSDPSIFGAYKATPSNTASGSPAATLSQVSGQTPSPASVTVNAQTVATSTSVLNNPNANAALNFGTVLAGAGTSVTATNGTASTGGSVTINGVSVAYDVTTQSLTTILNNIQTATGGAVTWTNNGNNTITLHGVTSLGSGADSGNLLQVLKLDTAQLTAGNVTSSSSISGINQTSTFGSTGNAGFATAVTSGTFTINGVQFTVNAATNSVSDLINQINASTAGVTASYNTSTGSITLASNQPGPQSILLGKGSDTSNFLTASGLKTGTVTTGTQASLSYTDNTGSHTVYSSTNTFTNVVPGFNLTITSSSPAALPAGSTFYTISSASDPSQAEKAINSFVTAYNAAIQTLNKDIAAPTVTSGVNSNGKATSASTGGGVLYGNYQISSLRDQLVQAVSGLINSGSSSYNSLQSIGLKLNTASTTVGVKDSSDSSDSSDGQTTITGGTDGTLSALDTSTFEAAYSANTLAVQALFTQLPSASSLSQANQIAYSSAFGSTVQAGFAYTFGNLIANANGLTTFLKNSVVTPANLNSVLLNEVLDSNNQQIDSLDQQINRITQQANNQADQLRAQFSASESQIAQLQALQQEVAKIGN